MSYFNFNNLDLEMEETSLPSLKGHDLHDKMSSSASTRQAKSESTDHSQRSSKTVNTQTAIQLPADVHVKSDVLKILIDHDHHSHSLDHHSPLRQRVYTMLHTTKFMISVIVLIILDICLILTELFLELVLLKKGLLVPEYLKMLFLTLSLIILSIFVIELMLRIYALGYTFFLHVLEVFDGAIIIVSFVIDVFEISRHEVELIAADLIILFRLWRVTRLFTGFISSLKMQAAIKSTEGKRVKNEMGQKISSCEARCTEMEKHIDYLTGLLRNAQITYEPYTPKSTVIL